MGEVPTNAIGEGRGPVINGPWDEACPAGRFEAAHRAGHMEGAGDEYPSFAWRGGGESKAEICIFGCIPGLAFEQQAIGRDALITEELARHVSLRCRRPRQVPQRATAAGEEHARFRKLPRKRKGSSVPVTSLLELHLAPVRARPRVLTTAQHNDPVDPFEGRLRGIGPFDWLKQQIAKRQDGQRKQRGQRDATGPQRKAPSLHQERQNNQAERDDNPRVRPQESADQFRGDEEDRVHQRDPLRRRVTKSKASR